MIPVNNAKTRGATGWCLEVHDLVVSKYAANREFVRTVIRHHLVDRATLEQRLVQTTLEPRKRSLIMGLLEQDFRDAPTGDSYRG